MTCLGIEFREGTASEEDIRAHFERCDMDFAPNLSLKVNVEEYSRKIKALAKTFEAWSGAELVGLVAAYMNDSVARIGFITSVSVAKEYTGHGIASTLLEHCLKKLRQEGMKAVRLEVNLESGEAIRLYTDFGFSEVMRRGETVWMEREISEKRQS
jgi:ribosomal protein S18 acetylase RimI-like enzyme